MLRLMRIAAVLVAWCWCLAASGQLAPPPAFDAASLKPAPPIKGIGGIYLNGGPGSRDPGQFTYRGATLRGLLFRAYGLIDAQQQVTGPAWIDSDRFDLVAKIPAGATEAQFQIMLQNLLAERFKLVLHHETKLLRVYELVPGKNGPKVKESVDEPSRDAAAGVPSNKQDRDGFPVVPAGFSGQAMHGDIGPGGQFRQNWVFRHQSMQDLAGMLTSFISRRTVDKTGLSGRYDFNLWYEPQSASANAGGGAANPGVSVFDAVEQQLGLKLVEAKDPFDLVVVDRAERTPAEN